MEIVWEPTAIDYVFGLAVAVMFLVVVVAWIFVRRNKRVDDLDRQFIQKRWKKIQELMSFGKQMNYKLAVIEADKLLDEALKSLHFSGKTMAERLNLASYKYPKLKRVWWAHKVRNKVVHDVRYELKYNETKKVLGLFKSALKILKAL
ncbi:MAG TPA: hypothetical protein VKP03_00805 [Patescibacteria group bacterium]|nr:hypothetical protein [Patescibacteria group bacterium]